MIYKTILLCAVIGTSMQNAWGMDREANALLKTAGNNESAQLMAAIEVLHVNAEALRKHNQELQKTSEAVENIVYNKKEIS
jgi:hypothetical protein